jgi:hypothetical protein
VQNKIDRERVRRRVVAARSIIACDGPYRAFRINRPIRRRHRQNRPVLSRVREEQLDVIVMGGADEPGQLLTANNDAGHFWRQVSHLTHLREPHLQFVTDAPRRAHSCCLECF